MQRLPPFGGRGIIYNTFEGLGGGNASNEPSPEPVNDDDALKKAIAASMGEEV